jgi:hypothetical protein
MLQNYIFVLKQRRPGLMPGARPYCGYLDWGILIGSNEKLLY